MIEIIEENEFAQIELHRGTVRFEGCQCIGDCACKEDFVPFEFSALAVRRKVKNRKTTTHSSIEEARKRFDMLTRLGKKENGK